MTHDPIKLLCYGDPGTKKSTLAATFPTPMLVFDFDPLGKDGPYVRRGVPSEIEFGPKGPVSREVFSRKKATRRLIRIEYYLDQDPTKPRAWERFSQRMGTLHEEYDQWKTIVFDSVTFMLLAKLNNARKLMGGKEQRRWYASATDEVESLLMVRCGAMPMNVVVLAHVSEKENEATGDLLQYPAAPGRLRRGLPAGFAETYRSYVKRAEGENLYLLQTERDASWTACTQIPAPNPCEPTYKALFAEEA